MTLTMMCIRIVFVATSLEERLTYCGIKSMHSDTDIGYVAISDKSIQGDVFSVYKQPQPGLLIRFQC